MFANPGIKAKDKALPQHNTHPTHHLQGLECANQWICILIQFRSGICSPPQCFSAGISWTLSGSTCQSSLPR